MWGHVYLPAMLLSSTAYAATNLTSLVNLFIGTSSGANGGSGGNAFPGAAVPHAMAKACSLSISQSLYDRRENTRDRSGSIATLCPDRQDT